MVLPAGFALPPLPYLFALLAAVAAVAGFLRRARPRVDERLVIGLVPWMAVGSALHALHQLGAAPGAVAPLLGTPAVYLATFALAGAVWAIVDRSVDARRTAAVLGVVGTVAFGLASAAVLAAGSSIRPAWSLVGLALAGAVAIPVWSALRRIVPETAATLSALGPLVVFAHALDGVSTAIGVDVLGLAERTPASRAILEFAGTLPTAGLLGTGWLFVAVKVTLAALVVHLFADYVRDDPAQGYLLLGLVAAVGLGPGAHNLLLYTVR